MPNTGSETCLEFTESLGRGCLWEEREHVGVISYMKGGDIAHLATDWIWEVTEKSRNMPEFLSLARSGHSCKWV